MIQTLTPAFPPMNRRVFFQRAAGGVASISLLDAGRPRPMIRYYPAHDVRAPTHVLPAGKRLPFGWRAFPVATDDTTLQFSGVPAGRPLRLRLTVAVDSREKVNLEVRSARTDQRLGTFDLRYATELQPFELSLPESASALLRQEGIRLRLMESTPPLWLLSPAPGHRTHPLSLQPHVLVDAPVEDPERVFWQTFGSVGSVQPFSWMEGCVTDGLYDWYAQSGSPQARRALDDHFDLFFDKNQRLVYENPRSEPADGTVYGIECPLPLAALARMQPNHPALGLLTDYACRNAQPDGPVRDKTTTTEGCYTLAYPLAVLARQQNSPELARLALAELDDRQKLVTEDVVFQRKHSDGPGSFANWGRGVGWYLLGTVRTLRELAEARLIDQSQLDERLNRFRPTVRRVRAAQGSDGAWHAYVGEPATGVDTSATASIATALALAVRYGWMPPEVLDSLKKTRQTLFTHLTPDGFLTGVCQSNRGGEALQRSGYRVIAQYASGLMAQFLAAMPLG